MPAPQFPIWDTSLDQRQRRAHLKKQLDAWIASAALSELASHWGSAPASDSVPITLFDWYDEFSSTHWDYRAGRERHLALPVRLTSIQERAAMAAAEAIGLLGAGQPRRSQYDFLLILGGLIRACITRPRYARELIDAGLTVGNVVALGGFRPLAGNEHALAEQLGVTAQNEFEAMIAGVRSAFPALGHAKVRMSADAAPGNADWAIACFNDAPTTVLAAPSREPAKRRANTADTFAWWAKRAGHVQGRHVLLVTNPIYVPYQAAAAIENLGMPFGVNVETVGISATAADLNDYTQIFGPANYLQEIRSAIRGYKSLYLALRRTTTASLRSSGNDCCNGVS